MIKLSKKNECGTYQVYWENGVYVGDFIVNNDGYYVYFPDYKGGYYNEHILKCLYEKLVELNEPWDNNVKKYFRQNDRTH